MTAPSDPSHPHNTTSSHGRLSRELEALSEICRRPDPRLGDFFDHLSARGNALISLIFSLPFLLPIPVPGLSVIFGILVFLMGGAILIDQAPWIPASWKKRPIPSQTLSSLLHRGGLLAKKLERFVRPRGQIFIRYPWVVRGMGAVIAICGLILALPLPPGTNFPPASAIVFLSLGLLEEDAVCLAIGFFLFVVNLVLFGALFFFGGQILQSFALSFG